MFFLLVILKKVVLIMQFFVVDIFFSILKSIFMDIFRYNQLINDDILEMKTL